MLTTHVAKFEKVPYDQYIHDLKSTGILNMGSLSTTETHDLHTMYESIRLPRRATKQSAGYDFFLPEFMADCAKSLLQFNINTNKEGFRAEDAPEYGPGISKRIPIYTMTGKIVIPTGIRCYIDGDYVLEIFPKSGLGCKYGVALHNTVGIIDADYYNADNYGHILLDISSENTSDSGKILRPGKGIAQGIFHQYFTAENDDDNEDLNNIRTGGFGSTNS